MLPGYASLTTIELHSASSSQIRQARYARFVANVSTSVTTRPPHKGQKVISGDIAVYHRKDFSNEEPGPKIDHNNRRNAVFTKESQEQLRTYVYKMITYLSFLRYILGHLELILNYIFSGIEQSRLHQMVLVTTDL